MRQSPLQESPVAHENGSRRHVCRDVKDRMTKDNCPYHRAVLEADDAKLGGIVAHGDDGYAVPRECSDAAARVAEIPAPDDSA